MSSSPSIRESFPAPPDVSVPYEDYAELLRTLLPGVRKICFYDHLSRARWISDDIEVPELTVQVTKVLLQATASIRDSRTAIIENGITHCAAVRRPDDAVRGAIALVLGRRRYGKKPGKLRRRDIEVALAPLLRILGHAPMESDAPAIPPPRALTLRLPVPAHDSPRRIQHDPFVGAAARAMSAPVIMRRTVSTAVDTTSCAFGALIAADRQLTLVHRGTAQQVQAELRLIVESLRHPMTALMHTRSEPLVVTSPGPSGIGAADYKFAVFPVRKTDGGLVALLVLFRHRNERDFNAADGASLRDIAARIPAHVLDDLALLPQESGPTQVPKDPASAEKVESERTAVALAEPVRTEPVRIEPSLEKRLRTALRQDGFDLHAQSITSLRNSSETTRCEVLLRLREQDGLQLPQTFFETAEQSGLLPDIDRWVIGRLLNTIRPHNEALQAGRWEFALNVSPASLQRESFGDFIEAQLFRSGVPPQALVLEFSEQDVLTHLSMFKQLAPRLAALGCRLALDNCRQGVDVFLSIGRLPVHRLKIDAALTQHITSDARAAHMVRELVEVARDVGIETVGERVEDEATCQLLRELGLDFAQGFNLAQPQPLIELLR